MLLYVICLFLMASGLWCVGRFGGQVLDGKVDRFFAPMRGSLSFREQPFRFVIHGTMWMVASLFLLAMGTVFLADLDPALLVLPPATFVAARGIARTLRQVGALSGDAGEGSVEALAGRDRSALVARVEALPGGAERRMLERALAAWTGPSEPDGYRHRGDPHRSARFDALRVAGAGELRRLWRGVALGAAGLLPAPFFVVFHERLVARELALLGSAIGATLAIGAVVVALVARRRVEALVARAAAFDGDR